MTFVKPITVLVAGICLTLLVSFLLLFTGRNCNVQCVHEVKLTVESVPASATPTVTPTASSTPKPVINAVTTSVVKYLSSFSSHLVPGVDVYFPNSENHTLSMYLPVPRDRPESIAAFVDLGSQGGNTHDVFLGRYKDWEFSYGLPARFSAESALAYMFEGNPVFCGQLAARSCAISFCPAVIGTQDTLATFFLDVQSTQQWGSALNHEHPDTVTATGERRPLILPMVDIKAFLRSTFKREDFVILKIDIEGYEWVLMPGLAADAEAAQLVDNLFYEEHIPHHNATQREGIAAAVLRFQSLGVHVEKYDSPMRK